MSLSQGIEFLESRGVNLFFAFDTTDIARQISDAVPELDLSRYPSTVLTAHAGYTFWQSLQRAGIEGDHPVDQYSILLAREFAERFLRTSAKIVYPSEYPISLMSIATKTGWSFTSPLGVSIHPKYGTWFAYRALFLVETQLPASKPLIADHPCESCVEKPCQTVCPSSAVGDIGEFKLETCARYRIKDSSPCAYQCLSRIACPVGVEYQYLPEQMKYHYNRSYITMLKYFGSDTKG